MGPGKSKLLAAAATVLLVTGCAKSGAAQPEEGIGTEASGTRVGSETDQASYGRLAEVSPSHVYLTEASGRL